MRTSITCSCRSVSNRPRFPAGRTAATCSPGSARSPSSGAWRRVAPVRIRMVNTGGFATPRFPGAAAVDYDGDTAIAGVPGTAAAIMLDFAGTEGRRRSAAAHRQRHATSSTASPSPASTTACRSWWWPPPRSAAPDTRASPSSRRTPDWATRWPGAAAGRRPRLMGLGDVREATMPKVSLIAAPGRRRDRLHPDLHPGARARLDRGARRGQRRDRAAARRRGRT